MDADGAFVMIARNRTDTPELVDGHRFTHAWEKTASLDLRHGRAPAIDTYLAHYRIADSDHDSMIEAVYIAWHADCYQGMVTVLIADTHDDVTALNSRARVDLILEGAFTPSQEIELHDDTTAGICDTVITHLNNRNLRTASGWDWVRDCDLWTITAVGDDGQPHSGED